MADDKLREAALKPIATIKKPVIAAEKKEEAKTVEKTVAKKPAVKKATTKKETAKKAEPKTVKKAEPKAAEKKEETKAAAVKKPAVKKTTAAKKTTTAKKAEAKPVAKKAAPSKKAAAKEADTKSNIVLQYADKSVTYDTLVENAKNVWQYDMGRDVAEIKTLEIYVKPEEARVYFVVNGEVHSDYAL